MTSSSDIRTLWVHGLTEPDMALLRTAKAGMNVDYQIVPKVAEIGSCGVSGRVLALREPPDFLTDHALVRDPENMEGLRAAIDWTVSRYADARATTVLQMVQAIIPGTREIGRDQLAYENISVNMHLNDRSKVPLFQNGEDETG